MAFFSTTLGKILKSKTVWGAAGLGVMTVLPAVAPFIPAGTKAGAVVGAALALFTIYGRIQAKQPLGPVIDDTIAKTVDAVHILGISAVVPGTTTGAVAQVAQVQAVVKQMPPPEHI